MTADGVVHERLSKSKQDAKARREYIIQGVTNETWMNEDQQILRNEAHRPSLLLLVHLASKYHCPIVGEDLWAVGPVVLEVESLMPCPLVLC